MRRYVLLREDGTVRGFLAEGISGEIPPEAIEISEDQYLDWYEHQNARRMVNGAIEAFEPPAPPEPVTPPVSKEILLARLEAISAQIAALPDGQ